MTKVQTKRLGKSLFADDAAVTTHSEEDLQQLMNRFADACKDFWACHQPQKDAGDGAPTNIADYRAGSRPRVCVLGFDNTGQPLP